MDVCADLLLGNQRNSVGVVNGKGRGAENVGWRRRLIREECY